MILFLSLTLSNAFARERMDEKPWSLGQYLGNVDSITLDKKIDVDGLIHKNNLYLEAKVGEEDRSWYFKISTSSAGISVSDDFVKANNLKVQTRNQNLIPIPSDYGVGGQLKTVTIPSLKIGDMILTNVQAVVSSSKGMFDSSLGDMQIGLGSLDVAYTLSPETGKISFAPTAQGNDIVNATGTAIPYDSVGWARVQYGKEKKIAPYRTLIVSSKISGIDVSSVLEAGSEKASITAWDLLPDTKTRFTAGDHLVYGAIALTGLNTNAWFIKSGRFHFGAHTHDAKIARDILFEYEMSVSPSDQVLSLKKVSGYKWSSLTKAQIPYLKKQTEPDEEGNEAEASDWSPLYDAYMKSHQYQEAIMAAQKLVELSPESCSNWDKLGDAFFNAHDLTKARSNYVTATERYHKWWDQDLDTRIQIQKKQGALKKTEQDALKEQQKDLSISEEPVWHHKQDYTCFLVDGKIAMIDLSNEQFDSVQKIYEKIDLDPTVAIAQGNAALVQGNLDLAEAAYRQAIRLEKTPNVAARYGLGLYFADQGEWRFADPLFAEAFALDIDDSIAASLWFDNARSNGEDTLQKALDLREAYPQNNTTLFLALREAKIVQDMDVFAKLSAQPFSEPALINNAIISTQIRTLVLMEKTEEASKMIEAYTEYANTAQFLVAKADLAAFTGDSTKAINYLKEAAKIDASHPAIALFLR